VTTVATGSGYPTAEAHHASAVPRIRRLLPAGLVALLVLVLVFVAEPMRIPSSSMAPTLRPGDQVLLNKLAYRFGSPRRGDLAVFRSPEDGETSLKRVVALPGDSVGIEDGVLVVDGRPQREPFVDHRTVDSVYFGPVVVPPGHVFVLGDNRADSRDSRDFGAVDEDLLEGRVALRLLPLRR
jgi:signal peptidase I